MGAQEQAPGVRAGGACRHDVRLPAEPAALGPVRPDLAAVQWVTSLDWIPSLGVKFSIGMDGISLIMVLLTTLLGFIAVWCSFTAIQERHKEYYLWILVMQFSMMGVFITQDMFLFYLFWELMLVPCTSSSPSGRAPAPVRRHQAVPVHPVRFGADAGGDPAVYFLQFRTTGQYDMSIASFQAMAGVVAQQSHVFQILLALAFFVGFAIKVPMFPFHTWLPDAHVEAPTADR